MALSSNYTVYKHTNRLNGKVYIGITSQKVERRWQNGAGYAKTYFGNAIDKYGWGAFYHEVIVSGLSKQAACGIEIALIAAYRSNDREHGYNIAEGGQTADVIRVKSGEDNPKSVKVKRVDPKTGESVIYLCISDAAKEMGINHRGISKACMGIAQTYKGFLWEYVDKEYEKRPAVGIGNYQHTKIMKRVKLTEPDGTVKLFASVKDAAETTGMHKSRISRYLLGIRADASGRGWSYCL